ncbi:hypothetical protein T4B_5794 [Trichinella pseudospiralis]|uniref:Uncharacterized protein n=1 Tax=Trichinella pseudospiralis TaxID=6337 RepID=A0A0V1IVU2_TRIPS|nr:hypothetical protein T4B_5794 [Trichinella pseudospiralis]
MKCWGNSLNVESLSSMEDNSQTEQVVDIINLIETTLPATSVPETTTEATILNLPFTEGVVLIGALVILLYWEEIEAKIYGRRSTEENILCQKPRHGFSTTPVGRLEKLRRQMKFIEEVPLEERVKKQSNIQID